ncbi:MAG TPA: histidine triad nucleotide-binding protein [Acidimicrobiales bacterium]|nr:histidine triad nucleotide-binding protein [Acidimicrobiales bacterium]
MPSPVSQANCLFCRIVAGEVRSERVATTEATYAFRDINPAAPVHVLVVPRAHIKDAAAIGPEHAGVVAELFTTAHNVAAGEGIESSGYRLVFNVGEDAQNSVGHLHLHVLGGRRLEWPPG